MATSLTSGLGAVDLEALNNEAFMSELVDIDNADTPFQIYDEEDEEEEEEQEEQEDDEED